MGKFFQSAAVIFIAIFSSTLSAAAAPVTAPVPLAPHDPLLLKTGGFEFMMGISDGMVHRIASANGYTDIRIEKRKLTKTRLHACKDGIKYQLEVTLEGKLKNRGQIGRCRNRIDAVEARRILRQSGFKQIDLTGREGGFDAVACRRDRRMRLSMNVFGEIQNEVVIGRCGGALSQADVADILHQRGYSKVRVDAQRLLGQRFSAKACRGQSKVALVVGPRGRILEERQTGACAPAIHPATIPALLVQKGFSRIEVIDRKLPRYVARACEGNRHLEISMNRYGRIVDERPIGRCDQPLTIEELKARLRASGYDFVQVTKPKRDYFAAKVCEEGKLYYLRISIFGETVNQENLGECPSQTVSEILKRVEKRGITSAAIFVEGCRGKKLMRFELDRYGAIKKRWNIGRCR